MQNPEELEQRDENFDNKVTRFSNTQNYSKNQKIAAIMLALFAIIVLVMWTIQFNSGLKSPFIYKGKESTTTEELPTEEQTNAELRSKDTDKDGLNDYEELNVYKTSPYIEDSDSDGIKDGDEIEKGTDPNCPTGRDCNSSESSTSSTEEKQSDNSTLNSLLNQYNQMDQLDQEILEKTTQDSNLSDLQSGKIDAQNLRQLLISTGMDKSVLDQISDEELISSYKETLQENK